MAIRLITAIALVLLAAVPGRAQEDEVVRQVFTFIETNLTVEVQTEAPGSLRLTRGDRGQIRVTARAEGGLAAAGLAGGGRERLNLTALGAEQVQYIVIVPAGVRVTVRLPDRHVSEVFGTMDEVADFSWAGAEDEDERGPIESQGAAPSSDGLFLAYSERTAPRVVRVPDLSALRTLTVRHTGDRFRIRTSRPLYLHEGSESALEIRPSGPPLDIVVSVPTSATDFALEIDGAPALLVLDGRAVPLCEPVVRQETDDGLWFTFTPAEGKLRCRDAPGDRRPAGRLGD